MQPLAGRIQHYAWGSRDVLARLTGRPAPSPEPEAELWLGAHEAAPSYAGDITLDALIAQNPDGWLGSDATRWEGRLPFLLKVLAPERPLSIQCHPDAEQALDAPAGTYADRSPKPEALVPLTPFEMFAGMLPYDDLCRRLGGLGVPWLAELVRDRCTEHDILAGVLAIPSAECADRVGEVMGALPSATADVVPAHVVEAVLRVGEEFPGDIGLVVLLLMHHRVVEPGGYVFVPAGVLHCYVGGASIEILANSDNIVRAGLTPKKIDVTELLRIVRTRRQMEPEVGRSEGRATYYPDSAPQFSLARVDPGSEPITLSVQGPRIVLAVGGTLEVATADQTQRVAAGAAVFVGADEGDMSVCGEGTAFIASSGRIA